MASKLPVDILSIIFEDIEQENGETLYSCIFVNKEWCQIAVPFLWKNPWKKVNNNTTNQSKTLLFYRFLLMMPKESKDFLKMNGIKFLVEDSFFKDERKPLFNYSSFCKIIDSVKINDMVCRNIKGDLYYHEYLVEQEILKLLISNTSKLKCLIMCYESRHPIAFFPNSSVSLSQLNELHCDTSIEPTIFYGLSQLCRNIERLVIEGYNDDNHGLNLFIKQQTNLKRVKVWEDHNFGCFAQGKYKNLGEALSNKSSSIIELDLERCPIIPPTLLKNFQKNLTIFKFSIDYDLMEGKLVCEFENVLKTISLPNLQQLIVYDECPPFDIIAKIIEKTNGKLKKINLGTCFYDEEDADMLVSVIAKHCPKLELLGVWIGNLNETMELIKECKNLRGLVLRSFYYKSNIDELFKVLCNDASNQLRKLQLSKNWKFSKEALNEFFESWKQNERISLDLYISSHTFKDDYEDIIKKYQEMGVIRKFDKCIVRNLLDDWE